jgi:DGQHR domain-containing protein
MGKINLNVLKSKQKNQTIFIGYLTVKQANELTFSDHYPPTGNRIGYQRPPEKKRADQFSRYIINNNDFGFATPILLNAREKVHFESQNDSNYGSLTIPNRKCLAIVDGQHRILGIVNNVELDIQIPFMLLDNLDTQHEQDLFVTINREQKKVSMSHVRFIGSKDDPLCEMVIKLESDPESPWYHRVNLVGARGTKRPVSLQSLRNSLEELLQFGEIKMMSFDQKYKIAMDFWQVVSEVWSKAWESPNNSLLKKSLGSLAVSKLGGYLIPQCIDRAKGQIDKKKLKGLLSRASEVNWMNDGDFQGYSGVHGADLVKNELDSLIFAKSALKI